MKTRKRALPRQKKTRRIKKRRSHFKRKSQMKHIKRRSYLKKKIYFGGFDNNSVRANIIKNSSQERIPNWNYCAKILQGIYANLSDTTPSLNEETKDLVELKNKLLSILNNNLINEVIAVTTKTKIEIQFLQYFAFLLSCVFLKLKEINIWENRGFNNLKNFQIYDFIKNLKEKDICVFFDLVLNGIDGNVAANSFQNVDDLQKFDDFSIFFIKEPTYIQGTFIQEYFTWANDDQKKIIANFISSHNFLTEQIKNKTLKNVYNILEANNVSNIRNVWGKKFLENALNPFSELLMWVNKVQEALQKASEDAGENTITEENLQTWWYDSIAEDDLDL